MRTFSQMLQAIRKSDDALREVVSEAAAYILIQYHKNGRKVDGAGASLRGQFITALPAWLQKEAGKWQLDTGKRIPTMDEREAGMRADAFVGMAFASQEDKRRIAKENREARKAIKAQESPAVAPESTNEGEVVPPPIDGEVLTAEVIHNALIVNGEAIELSEEEATALESILIQMRSREQLRIAA